MWDVDDGSSSLEASLEPAGTVPAAAVTDSAAVKVAESDDEEEDEPILRIRFLCEPGEDARVLSVDDSTGHEWRSATLH